MTQQRDVAQDLVDHPEPLWRELTGRVLRRHRLERRERLVETASRAGISTQYLSEVERGRKDASSEVVAAVAGALGLSLLDLTLEVARDLHPSYAARPTRPAPVVPLVPRRVTPGRPTGPLALAA